MQLKKEELKKQGKVEAEFSEITEEDIINAFGVTKDHMLEAAKMLEAERKTKKLGHPSAWLPAYYGPENYGKVQTKMKKKFSPSKQVVQRTQHLKLMLMDLYFHLYLTQVYR